MIAPTEPRAVIDVLVVEDSRVTRDFLVHLLEGDPAIRVGATADSGEAALVQVAERRPDVIVMDVHLPGIDGVETTARIMSSVPVPIVVCTAADLGDVSLAMRALEAGAVSVLRKPAGGSDARAAADADALVTAVKLMSEVTVVRRRARPTAARPGPGPGGIARTAVPFLAPRAQSTGLAVVAIGASTGGPQALRQVLAGLRQGFPAPILVVQHIASGFTAGLVDWLAGASGVAVHIALDGEDPMPGHVYVAPDDRHLVVGPSGELRTPQTARVQGLRPAVGVLFDSVADRYGRRAVGVLLTGMGRDGADGLKRLAGVGAVTIAQDQASSVVFGMPGEAIMLGGVAHVLPPGEIAAILNHLAARASGASR